MATAAPEIDRIGFDDPVLLLDPRVVEDRYRELNAALPGVTLHYAVKANPHPVVLQRLRSLGAHFDIASPAEAAAALAAGAGRAHLISSNPVQSRAAIDAEYASGVRMFVVDSLDEARKVAEHAPGSALLARLSTSGAGSDWPLSGKFGASEDEVVTLLIGAESLGLRAAGVAFHVGSQQREPERWIDPIETSGRIFRRLTDRGLRPWLLDLGGGFPAHHRDYCPPLAEYGRVITQALNSAFGARRPNVIAEPGRSLVADAAVLEARVLGITWRGGRRWVYLNAGVFNGLTETLGEAIHYRITTEALGVVAPAVLAGPTCDSTDVMYQAVDLPMGLAEGDLVRFHAAGAYTTCYASNFNGFAPLETRIVGASA